jgi:hypothetical protein
MTITKPKPNNQINSAPGTGLNLTRAVIDTSVIHTNVGQEIVITTEDKLELCLRDHQDILKAKTDWKTPASLFIALLTTIVAADFKEFGFNSETWFAIYLVLCVICGFWLAISVKNAYDYRDAGDTKQIIEKLKSNSQNKSSAP